MADQRYTVAEAAGILKVRESWLKTKAAARLIPCTFIGKHLRFSDDDIAGIMKAGDREPARPASAGQVAEPVESTYRHQPPPDTCGSARQGRRRPGGRRPARLGEPRRVCGEAREGPGAVAGQVQAARWHRGQRVRVQDQGRRAGVGA
jgi:hypothetical protein